METFLEEALKTALSSHPLKLYISTQEWSDTEPLYNDPSVEAKCKKRRQLIFVSQVLDPTEESTEDKKPTPTTPSQEVYILGLSVLEYETARGAEEDAKVIKTIYIDKLDSSGYGAFPARGSVAVNGRMSVARALIHGYLRYCANEYLRTNEEIFLHVFARSQPQYLFAESAKNPKKNILNDQELIQWWKRSLHSLSTSDLDTTQVQGYWYVPGADDMSLKASTATEDKTSFSWKWGWPYNNKDKALHVIPQFPDDAKSRLSAKDHMENVSVWEFFELLSISEECGSGRRAGFFVLHMSSGKSSSGPEVTKEPMDQEQFHEVEEQLYYLDFSCLDECVQSTRKLNDLLIKAQALHVDIVPNKIEPLPEQSSSKRKTSLDESPNVNVLSSSLVRKKPKVNVLGGSLIRKKPKTD
ncbi:hypothetical protein K493DRAFT_296982 [Basidiobolus meristosporus CBS 931.73]|uniref:histone acetyltransferase n=1 Tax=Basidiobolus meristosporus CBS 931.73 TaxID=1314790 RepID=A0A1Y1Z299_9FUNG|nr:hypothetical protein K493DRAFT_296982 [Basidiobolus meristosporus CBS 931.73]|eukprot:ORY04412.1 hypothetical protein K493DRAFT_296982 [Basidiobolus meristosporus CBS 931.73]